MAEFKTVPIHIMSIDKKNRNICRKDSFYLKWIDTHWDVLYDQPRDPFVPMIARKIDSITNVECSSYSAKDLEKIWLHLSDTDGCEHYQPIPIDLSEPLKAKQGNTEQMPERRAAINCVREAVLGMQGVQDYDGLLQVRISTRYGKPISLDVWESAKQPEDQKQEETMPGVGEGEDSGVPINHPETLKDIIYFPSKDIRIRTKEIIYDRRPADNKYLLIFLRDGTEVTIEDQDEISCYLSDIEDRVSFMLPPF